MTETPLPASVPEIITNPVEKLPEPLPLKEDSVPLNDKETEKKSFWEKFKSFALPSKKETKAIPEIKKENELPPPQTPVENSEKTETKGLKGKVENWEEKFIALEIQRQVDIFLGIIMIVAILTNVPGKIIVLPLAVAFLFSGLAGKKFFITSLFEKAPWNKKQ